MAIYICSVCGYIYDESKEKIPFNELKDDFTCPVCDSSKKYFKLSEKTLTIKSSDNSNKTNSEELNINDYLKGLSREDDLIEKYMDEIHQMSITGESIMEPMRTKKEVVSWDDILIKGAQLYRIPLNKDDRVNTQTIIGPKAKRPLVIDTPIYITHMSFGAISKEIKIALAKGSAKVETAMCSGEGGILNEEFENSYKYIFEYVPNKYSVSDENLKKVDAIEIKFGQSVKPGMGGHLPAKKVTKEIADIRGFKEGQDIISPSHFNEIKNKDDLKKTVSYLREKSDGKPIGIKIAAGDIEKDLEIVVYASPDFITIDGRPGGTGSSPKFIKDSTSIPTLFALYRARKFLDDNGVKDISLVITGGLRISSDFAKALALGADAIAIGTAALMSCACQQYRVCNTGKCPMGVTTHDPELRARINIDLSAKRLENYLKVSTDELKDFARLTGYDDIHKLSIDNLCTTNSEISNHTEIKHV